MTRVVLPAHLRALARVQGEVVVSGTTIATMLDALEAAHPALRGTLRDPRSGARRAFVRFFACEQDWSHEPTDRPLPEAVLEGREPLLVIGAMAGG